MYIGVYAYGEDRFDLTFNPCDANIASLCPLNSSVPIEANGIIPVSNNDVAAIPPIALSIPDFEGEAILRIFANSTQSEIACFSAVITNGGTFSQPASVGTILGLFALVAILSSFATAIYGDSVPVMRKHYAHSLSVLVVFAVFQHIFFTGAMSMNWPSVLVAWWSNFAWAGGMIHSSTMQNSINHLIGNNIGNTSQVGAAGSGTSQQSLGGGFDLSLIYKRALSMMRRDIARDIYQRDHSVELQRDAFTRSLEHSLQRRALANSSTGYNWYGKPIGPGMPLPGNYSGFAGTLAVEDIRASNAFMTGFLWFLILIVLMVAAVVAFKWAMEAFIAVKLMRKDRLAFFRQHWLGYTALVALRTCFIGFFMMMFLTMFQFSYSSSGGVKAVAAIVFIIFFVGIPGASIYAYLHRVRRVGSNFHHEQPTEASNDDSRPALFSKLGLKRLSSKAGTFGSIKRVSQLSTDVASIHDDEEYIKKFGWLSARFRRTRWWFFGAWVFYEFIRACFYAGASGHAMTQVFGLLVVEFLAFCGILWARPFEGKRLNVIVVYLLGFSKVATVALSAAFDISFNLPRITTTIIGIAIIIVQGVLAIVTLIAIVVGAISSYLSVTRNQEDFRPKRWEGMREKYFRHIDQAATDLPPPPPPVVVEEELKGPYFNVASVRRMAKIEDEDPEFVAALAPQEQDPAMSYAAFSQKSNAFGSENMNESSTSIYGTRAASRVSMYSHVSNSHLPYGARPIRPSWSTRDFEEWNAEYSGASRRTSRNIRDENVVDATPVREATTTPTRSRTPARSATLPASMIRPAASVDSLRVGGTVSTPDTIGIVPSPSTRPRSGTVGGRVGGRSRTPNAGHRSSIPMYHLELPMASSSRPLTPAEEQEELTRIATKKSTR